MSFALAFIVPVPIALAVVRALRRLAPWTGSTWIAAAAAAVAATLIGWFVAVVASLSALWLTMNRGGHAMGAEKLRRAPSAAR
jgi:hypothetical protein